MSWLWTLLVLNLIVATFLWLMLTLFLPKRIKSAVVANGRRLDGTISSKRVRTERRELRSVIGTAVAYSLPFLFLLNLVLVFAHFRVAPLPMAGEALQNFSWSESQWHERLEGGETQNLDARYEDWKSENGFEGGGSLIELAGSWPVAVVVFALMTALMFYVCGSSYIAGLKRLEQKIKKRHQGYLAYDMRQRHQMVEASNRFDRGPCVHESTIAN